MTTERHRPTWPLSLLRDIGHIRAELQRPPEVSSRNVVERMIADAGESWTTRDEARTPSFLRLLNRANPGDEILIVSGELSDKFWEQRELLIAGFRDCLERDVKLRFIFSKDSVSGAEEARVKLEEENSGLVALAKEFPSAVTFRWVRSRPKQHFTVSGDAVMLEEPRHLKGAQPWTLTRWGDRKWVKRWQQRFARLWESGEELKVGH